MRSAAFLLLAGLSSASSLKLKAMSIWILTERASIAARGAAIGAKKAPAARAKRATRSARSMVSSCPRNLHVRSKMGHG